MSKLIYVIEDEADILELLQLQLHSAGYSTKGFSRAQAMLDALEQALPDLVLLDLMLPGLDGLEACRIIKSNPTWERIPIVMLTARADIRDRVRGLDYGADDYITKPFDTSELLARIKAILRRSGWENTRNVLNITEDFCVDYNKYEATIKGQRADLTLTEFKILQLLTQRPGWVFSRGQILDHLWGNDKIVIERTIDVHIRNLREKLGEYSYMVKNVRGVGYKFSPSLPKPDDENEQA
jgi:two-component system phosphate regulon response regulator PhoB/two-component system alkaline phosphatase synthesis response regulator PhoP